MYLQNLQENYLDIDQTNNIIIPRNVILDLQYII